VVVAGKASQQLRNVLHIRHCSVILLLLLLLRGEVVWSWQAAATVAAAAAAAPCQHELPAGQHMNVLASRQAFSCGKWHSASMRGALLHTP
jgi:hypothetical protein